MGDRDVAKNPRAVSSDSIGRRAAEAEQHADEVSRALKMAKHRALFGFYAAIRKVGHSTVLPEAEAIEAAVDETLEQQ
jgi:hypothetical protein